MQKAKTTGPSLSLENETKSCPLLKRDMDLMSRSHPFAGMSIRLRRRRPETDLVWLSPTSSAVTLGLRLCSSFPLCLSCWNPTRHSLLSGSLSRRNPKGPTSLSCAKEASAGSWGRIETCDTSRDLQIKGGTSEMRGWTSFVGWKPWVCWRPDATDTTKWRTPNSVVGLNFFLCGLGFILAVSCYV